MLRPAGHVPEATCHVEGGAPPVAASVCEYAAPATAAGSVAGVLMARGPSVMVSEKVWLAVWRAASVTVMLKAHSPGVVGTPAITPFEPRVRRGGRTPELKMPPAFNCHT